MWYVMQVRTGTEENVRMQCERMLDPDVCECCFIPYFQQKKRYEGEWHIQERILFPGYVFLFTQNYSALKKQLTRTRGISKIVGNGYEMVPFTDEEINFIFELVTEKQMVEFSTGVIENNQVHILKGPLKGLENSIRKIDRHKRKAWLKVETSGRSLELQVGLEIVEKS